MMNKEPRTLSQFRRWLKETCDELETYCRYAEPDFFDELNIAQTVEQASRLACRFGAGHLIEPGQSLLKPLDGLAVVGRLLAWADEQAERPAELMSVEEVGQLLGVSSRTVWRMVSASEIPAAVKIGGSTKWRRADIQAMIDLAEPTKR